MSERDHKTIVVGVDGGPESQHALRWAVREAERRDLELSVVHAYDSTRQVSIYYEACVSETTPSEPERKLVADAVDQARLRLGVDHASGVLVAGAPAGALLEAAAGASVLVVGSHSGSVLRSVLVGSVSGAVAAHASCPVVVVRGEGESADRSIVVGVDGSEPSEAALRFAFERAAREHLPVRAVHCWTRRGHLDPELFSESALARHIGEHRAWLDGKVASYQRRFPGVEATTRVLEGSAALTLVDEARGAGLLVVGSRGHGGVAGLLLCSTSQGVLHHAMGTVAVVRSGERKT